MDNSTPLAYVWPDGEYYIVDELDKVEPETALGYTKSDDYKVVYQETNLNDEKKPICAIYLTGIGCSNCAKADPVLFNEILTLVQLLINCVRRYIALLFK